MMRYGSHKKVLVLGIIVLFIGIGIAPNVTSIDIIKDKSSNSNDLVEITLQFCKNDGVEDHKMFITQEQDEQLKLLIESFKADLNNAETREETIEIYKDMVVSLDELGILPESTNCKEVQELVTGENIIGNPEIKSIKHFELANEKLKNRNLGLDENENIFCLIAGKTTETFLFGYLLLFTALYFIPFIVVGTFFEYIRDYFDISEDSILNRILTTFQLIFYLPFLPLLPLSILAILQFFLYEIPKLLGGIITLGNTHWEPPYEDVFEPAEGWIMTRGLNGKISYDESFYGKLRRIQFITSSFYLGITGFTGFNIFNTKTDELFYLGFALHVKIDSSPWV